MLVVREYLMPAIGSSMNFLRASAAMVSSTTGMTRSMKFDTQQTPTSANQPQPQICTMLHSFVPAASLGGNIHVVVAIAAAERRA
jgi:hypothetical protein